MGMSLRKSTLIMIVLITIGLSSVILTSLNRILGSHFGTQENNNTYLSIEQVNNVINQEISFLDKTSLGLASSDPAYQFLNGDNPDFTHQNLNPAFFQDLDIDLLILVNNRFETVYAAMIDKAGQWSANVPDDLRQQLSKSNELLAEPQKKQGLYSLGGRSMMIVTRPILRGDGSGPPLGTLITGKLMDQEAIRAISGLLKVSLSIIPAAQARDDAQLEPALAYQPTTKDPYYVELTSSQVSGFAPIKDITGQPSLLLRVDRYPNIYNNGLLVQNYLVISIIMITTTFAIIQFLMIELAVLRPIRKMSRAVQAIGASGTLTKRIPITRKDELSPLALKINEMLEALEHSMLRRSESENRFQTLVESMQDLVMTVDRGSRQVKFFERPAPSQPGAEINPAARAGELLRQDMETQLSSHSEWLERSFGGEAVVFEWENQTAALPRNYITTLSPIYNVQKSIAEVVGVSKDITSQKKLEQDLRRRIGELGALFHVSQELLNHAGEAAIYETICALACAPIEMDAAWIAVPSVDGSALLPRAAKGLDVGRLAEITLTPQANCTLEPAADAFNRAAIRFYNPPSTECQTGSYRCAAVPFVQAGRSLAVLTLVKRAAPWIGEENLPLIHAFVNLASVAVQNTALFEQVSNSRLRLQAVSKRLVEVQEEERRKIALEFHDEIGQVLTGLRLSVDVIQTLPPEQVNAQVQACIAMINEMIGRVRQISLDLRPSMLDDLGIIPTLIWYFERYTQQTGIAINFQHNNILGQRFSAEVELTVFRVIQEGLTNIARYAGVKNANVRLWRSEEVIGIQVEDEGAGFDEALIWDSRSSKGLVGMRERVGFLNGQLSIVTQPGEGTCLTVEIPLEDKL